MLGLDPSATNFPWSSNAGIFFGSVCSYCTSKSDGDFPLQPFFMVHLFMKNELSVVAQMVSIKGHALIRTSM